jgi:hypothetical protein
LDEIEREHGVKRELPTGISRDYKGLRVDKLINGVRIRKRFTDLDSANEFLNNL